MKNGLKGAALACVLLYAVRCERPDVHRRRARQRPGRQRGHPWRHGAVDQRSNPGHPRRGLERPGRLQLPCRRARHLYDQGLAHRLQGLRDQGRPNRHPAVRDPRRPARGRNPAGNRHRDGCGAAHRDLQRLDRWHARPRSARGPAGPRPQRLPHRHHGADRHDGGRSAVQPAAGSEQRLARVARRWRNSGQQLPARRRADYRTGRPRGAEPHDRSGRGSEGPGPHLRRRDGPDRRRRVQRDGAVRDQPVPRLGLLPDPPRVGRQRELLRREDGPIERGERAVRYLLPAVRRRRRRADRAGTAPSSGRPPKATARTPRATSSRSGRA